MLVYIFAVFYTRPYGTNYTNILQAYTFGLLDEQTDTHRNYRDIVNNMQIDFYQGTF